MAVVTYGTKKKIPSVTGKAAPGVKTTSTTAKVGSTTSPKIRPVNPAPSQRQGGDPMTEGNIAASGFGAASTPGTPTPPPTGSGSDLVGTDRWTGFADRYTPGSAQTIYDNPQLLANDVLESLGYGNNSALQGMYRDVGSNALPLSQLYGLIRENAGGFQSGTDNSILNTMADYLGNMSTVGGKSPDAAYLMQQLLNPSGLLEEYLNPDLGGGNRATAEEQMGLLSPLFQAATQGMAPLFQKAYQSSMNRGLTDFNSGAIKGQDPGSGSFIDYLRRGGYIPVSGADAAS